MWEWLVRRTVDPRTSQPAPVLVLQYRYWVGKLSVSAFQNFFRIENPLGIKEVMSQNVCVCSFSNVLLTQCANTVIESAAG